jgi:tetratricopeptide (TPR) repeat protein
VLAQYVRAHLLLGRRELANKQPQAAIEHFKATLTPPHCLGEAWHPLASTSAIEYWLGVASEALGQADEAKNHWKKAAACEGDFLQMQVRAISTSTYWSALALERLGETDAAAKVFQEIYDYSLELEKETPKIDYFATSLPAMLLFDEDLGQRQRILATFLRAQALAGKGETARAVVLLQEVEKLDSNHSEAADLLASLAGARQ